MGQGGDRVIELLLTCSTMLIGEEGVDWLYYRIPKIWWPACLEGRKN